MASEGSLRCVPHSRLLRVLRVLRVLHRTAERLHGSIPSGGRVLFLLPVGLQRPETRPRASPGLEGLALVWLVSSFFCRALS